MNVAITNPKTGDVVYTDMGFSEAVELCAAAKGEFPQKLAQKAKDSLYLGGKFSECQLYWLYKLAHDIKHPAEKPHGNLADGAFKRLTELFNRVDLKWPKLRFQTDIGTIAIIYARRTERIYVKTGDRFCGEIVEDQFNHLKTCPDAVKLTVEEVAKDPQLAAITWGKKTGRCCFCSRELTTAESVTAGYGPVCADKWGLPWGRTGGEEIGPEDIEGLTADEIVAMIKKLKGN